ncbi:MAG: 4Fe-4S dicluster domain-containing protein [Pseudomonadota bacterium]
MCVTKVLRANGMNRCIGCFTCMLACAGINRKNHSISKSAIKIRTIGGLEGRFISVACVGCSGVRACVESCPSGALFNRPGGGVLIDPDKCVGCRRCEKACIMGAVFFDEDEQHPMICKQCGLCTKFCPHNCLKMEETADELS